jgi:hypothetical protein
MKKFVAIIAALSVGVAQAASLNLFGGTINAASFGGSSAQTQGASGAALVGVAGTGATQTSTQQGAAGGVLGPSGVVVEQAGTSSAGGASTSFGLGLGAGASTFGGGAGNVSGATGTFGTIGIGILP